MKYKRFLFSALLSSLVIFVSSCSVLDWFGGKVSDEEITELDKDISKASARVTRYDDSLRQFGKLLEAYNIPQVRVQSKIISNETADASLPQDVSKMMATSINKIGKEIVYIPYDPNYVINESTTGGAISRTLPQVVIAGGITEYDKDMIEKNRELKAEGKVDKGQWGSSAQYSAGAGYDASESASRIALDLNMLEYTTQTAISHAQTSNAILVRKTKLGWGVGAFFEGCGLTFDYSLKKQQGIHYAIRLLVELSVLETLGKYFDVPYWRCIPDAGEDKALVTKNTEEFDYMQESEKFAYIKEFMFFHGYNIGRAGSQVTEQDMALINEAMKKYNSANYTELFIQLWKTVPIEESRKRNIEYKKTTQEQQRQYVQEQANLAAQQQAALQQQQQAASEKPQITSPAQEQNREQVQTSAQVQEQKQPVTERSTAPQPKSDKEVPIGLGATDW